jgi:hypothetical protein
MTNSALAQNLRQDLYVTDGTVFTAATSGNTLYLGGSFNQVGPPTGFRGADQWLDGPGSISVRESCGWVGERGHPPMAPAAGSSAGASRP